ncbi:hypothetical protein KAZ66_05850, partial [Candidatus Woesebacteria bacterium]|nr:hypothetical protein [Candidatus Woesebacteria bacterium]
GKVLEKVLQDETFRREFKHLALSASAAKDVTLGFLSVDFDEAREYENHGPEFAELTAKQHAETYTERLAGRAADHYKRIFDCVYDWSPYMEEEDYPEFFEWYNKMKTILNVF